MIRVTHMHGHEFILNAELIETVESTPDTIITTTTERKFIVRERADEVVHRVVEYWRAVHGPPPDCLGSRSQVAAARPPTHAHPHPYNSHHH